MSATEIQSKLHKIIDQVTDKNILQAIHTLLQSQINVYGHTSHGKPITKKELDMMLAGTEEEIRSGKTISAHDLKKEIKTWRKK